MGNLKAFIYQNKKEIIYVFLSTFFFTLSLILIYNYLLDKQRVKLEITQKNLFEAKAANLDINYLQEKITAYKDYGIDVAEILAKIEEAKKSVIEGQIPLAKFQLTVAEKNLDSSLFTALDTSEKTETAQFQNKTLEKADNYKKQGVNISEIENKFATIQELINLEEYSGANKELAALNTKLDALLAAKKEQERVALETQKKAEAQKATASVQSQKDQYSSYESRTVSTSRGDFVIDLVTIDLSNPRLRIITDTGNDSDCAGNCVTKSLSTYVSQNNGFAAINGSYFCPPDYASCAGKEGSYDLPVLNTRLNKMINESKLAWFERSIFAFGGSNRPSLFVRSDSYPGGFTAAMGNFPALVNGGAFIVNESKLDDKQRNAKINRGGIGARGNELYLVVAKGATVADLGAIFVSLGAEIALNLDGGGSSALYYRGSYKVGPGRALPNAIIFAE